MKRIYLLLIFIFAYSAISLGQVPTESYIRTRTLLKNDGKSYNDRIVYYDGLGRPLQTVRKSLNNGTADILATLQEYDNAGRESNTWLPIKVSSDFTSPASFKSSAPGNYGGDTAPYSKQVYEPSPLNRITQAYGAGAAWHNGHPVGTNYMANLTEAPLNCIKYGVSSTGALTTNGVYDNLQMQVTHNTDEDGNVSFTFIDRLGRTLLERQMKDNETYDTYYVYDDSNRLCFVLQPMYQSTGNISQNLIQYVYDDHDNCITKSLPGASYIDYVYDDHDRMTFSQDGNQRAAGNKWTFYEYDYFNRLKRQGECTNKAVSTTGVAHIQNFYDVYTDFRSAIGNNGNYPDDTSLHSKGHLTGSIITVLGSSETIKRAHYYDIKGRETKTVQNNLLGGYDITTTVYTFTGKPATVTHTHTTSQAQNARTEVYTYSYDYADRVNKVQHSLGGSTITLYSCTYDKFGRLYTKSLHGSATNMLTYNYNLRSWLTGISGTRFTQNLYYNTGNGTTKYNGNITSMTWKAGNESTLRGYKFTYDALDRMLNATYGETASISTNLNRFSENITGYDKNGNITGLQRYGQISASTTGLIDNLTYTLTGNQLNRVDDAATASAYNAGFEFKDNVKQAGEYAYDANGNLTKDLNKGISSIQYNILNLPSVVTFNGGNTITYTYAADGTKLRTVHKIGATTTTTDYCANVIYEGGTQKFLLTGEGYYSFADSEYRYYLKDHQGNNRVVINSAGIVKETNHYYPFGGVYANTGNVQRYKYNGKELDTKNGLNWYDYGARHYDPALGRFTTVDPMAEKYYSTSMYTYCGNSPIRFVDPDGQMKVIYNPDGTYKETTHNNWFHNTFVGRQEYISYGDRKVQLSEQEFWDWQRTGSYGSIQSTDIATDLEFYLDEPATGITDGIVKFALGSGYSLANSPKVMLTGRTWSGASQTSTEKIGNFIDVISNYVPVSRMSKTGNPGSWYKFKKANKHIPVSKKRNIYEAEMRRYESKSKNFDLFEKIKSFIIDPFTYINNNQKEEK